MDEAHRVLIKKLREHSRLSREDVTEIAALTYSEISLATDADLIRQGDNPDVSALVLSGVLARYHLLADGRRQYLSFHLAGDMPDSQALFIDRMDHAVCAIGPARVASFSHDQLLHLFEKRQPVAYAIWRETLVDAAIFREAIANNSARTPFVRMAHFFCEIFYRARASGLTLEDRMDFPITLMQLGETLAMAIATVNRALTALRATRSVDFRNGELVIRRWDALASLGQFDPHYLHLKKPPE
jgi:CRP-like cAMP-binding protein